jgi:hypothetical protein
MKAALTGTLIRDPDRDAIPIQMNATFGVDTVYFEWPEDWRRRAPAADPKFSRDAQMAK